MEIRLSAEALARTRFAISPLWEVTCAVRTLRQHRHAVHQPWIDQVRPRVSGREPEFAPLTGLVSESPAANPDFLTPPPSTFIPDLEVELGGLRDGTTERDRLIEAIRAFWEIALAPYWPRLRPLLERDVTVRAKTLAERGAAALFGDLHEDIGWRDGTVTVSGARHGRLEVTDRELVLVPSVFAWPRRYLKLTPPWNLAIRYPARGLGTLWERTPRAGDALIRVLGRSRARILTELDGPATTTSLAGVTGLTPGGVSQHLTALRAAGLVRSLRGGREVHYSRTTVGHLLVNAAHRD